ncbi:Stage II sporulation protein E (SpoIIE) [compost metagenome]
MLHIVSAAAEQLNAVQKRDVLRYPPYPIAHFDQDAYICNQEDGIFAVADGVGSRPHSDLAAKEVLAAFVKVFSHHGLPATAEQARERIHDGLIDRLQRAAALTQGATTLTGMVVTPDGHVTYISAGDSQFLIRRPAQIIRQTSEQTLKQEVPGQQLHGLYNFFGMVDGYDPYVPRQQLTALPGTMTISQGTEWGSVKLQRGDRLILVTDGVIGDRPDERLSELDWLGLTRRALGAKACAHALVNYSRKVDDTTAVVVDYGAVQPIA